MDYFDSDGYHRRLQLPAPILLAIVSLVAFGLSASADRPGEKLAYGVAGIGALVFSVRIVLDAWKSATER